MSDAPTNLGPRKSLRTRFRQLGPTGLLGLAAIILPLVGMAVLFTQTSAIAEQLKRSVWGPIIAVGAFALLGGFALLPTAALSILAGVAFGFGVGLPTALAGFTGASVIAYAVARRATGRGVGSFVHEHPRWEAIRLSLLGGGTTRTFLIVALLRLTTVPPFAATTVALAALGVRRAPFLLGTIVGIAPRTAVYVFLASEMKTFDPRAYDSWQMLAVWGGVTLAILAVMTILARRALARMTT